MQTFKQFLAEETVPDHTKNPFHETLVKHGFEHKKSTEGPYKGSEWHHYEHPEKGNVQATVYPKGHSFGETHWRHSHTDALGNGRGSSAGKTAKSLHDYLSHPDSKKEADWKALSKIRGVHHMGF